MPPYLLLAALSFWGWQTGFLLAGVVMGVLLESARFIHTRWNLDDADFNRIWTFCVVFTVMLVAYAFTSGETGGGFGGIFGGPPASEEARTSLQSAERFLRWLPLTTFGFLAAQTFNVRPTVPLTAASLVLRWRRRRGDMTFKERYLDISFPYFMLCLFSAGIQPNLQKQSFFLGLGALVAWALWSLRSRRFGAIAWLAALTAVVGLGFAGEMGINQAEQAIQSFSAQWVTRLFGRNTDPSQSITSMGQIGRLKLSAKIVVWIDQGTAGYPPTYLREASYRTYGDRNETWFVGGPRNDFEHLYPEPDNSSWLLVTGKQATASANITCFLNGRTREGDPEGLLPLPSGCCQLVNLPMISSVIELRKNQTGAVLATGSGLMVFGARYGPGATLDSPPDTSTNHLDLRVPASEVPALEQVIAGMNLTNADFAQTLRTVRRFFLNHFTYSVWQDKDQTGTANASPLTRFLLTTHRGHCEYFATATVLMLRELKIPARYAVGYYVHEPRGKGYVVRERDAHAWCLVWNEAAKTWENFDTTPPSWVAIETARAPALEWLEDLGSWIGLQIERFRWRQANLHQYIFGALLPVMAVLLYYILFRHRKKQKDSGQSRKRQADIFRPGLDSEFYLLERRLAARGVARPPGEPLSDWLERLLADPALAGLKTSLRELLRLHYCYRFDPHGISAQDRETLARSARDCLDQFSQQKQNSRHPA